MRARAWVILFVAAISINSLRAQLTTATILGSVRDASGGVIQQATIEAKVVATNLVRSTVTDAEGNYILTNLPVGEYELTASATGFKKEIQEGIILQVAQRARIDIVLQTGSVNEAVSVTALAPLINTDDGVFGDVIDNRRVVDLPLNGRNFNTLALLTPDIQNGVPGGATLQNFLAGGIGVWAHGNRDTDNEWNLDGATMSIGFYNWNSFNPSIDAIQEFKMQTGNYSAEFGFQAGANIDIVTKSGTNQVHGTLYDFLRNDKMDARGFFPTSKPELRQNQFGGTVGGPVYIPKVYKGKNRTFFFSNYEGLRVRQQSFGRFTVPTPAQGSGDLTHTFAGALQTNAVIDPSSGAPFPGNIIPANRITRQAQNILNYFPKENTPNALFNYQVNARQPTGENSTIQKIDHRISDKDSLFARGAYDNRLRPDPEYFPSFFRTTGLKAYNVVARWTRIWSPAVIQDLQLDYNRSFIFQSDSRENTNFSILNALGIPGIPAAKQTNGFPLIAIDGYSSLGDMTNDPLIQPDEVYQFVYGLSVHRSRHHFKTGLDLRRVRSDRTQGLTVRGQFNFLNANPVGSGNGYGDFLLGLPQQTSVGDRAWTIRMRQYRIGTYLVDDWQISPRLTLNLGIRWEPTTPVHDHSGEVTGFDFVHGVSVPLRAGQQFYPSDYTDFAPRIAFAFRPFKTDRTVIRGGYGIYFNSTMNLALFRLGSNPPWANITNYFAAAGSPLLTFDNPFPLSSAGVPPPPNYGALTPDFKIGYSQLRSLHIAQQLSANDAIEVGYVGTFALGGDRAISVNDAPPGPGAIQPRRRFPQYGVLTDVLSDAKTFYNAGTAKFTRRFSTGFTALSSFTFSRSIDQSFSSVAGNPTGGAVSQDYHNTSQRGLSSSHRKFVWVSSAVYDLPYHGRGVAGRVLGGWQVATIATVQSGGAFNITELGGVARLNTGTAQVSNRIANGNLSSSQRSIYHWFDTSAFVFAPMYTFGNSESRALIMPGLFNIDFNAKKAFQFTESVRLEFRGEFFNILNHTNFDIPGNTLGAPTFGVISSAEPARISQMSLKIVF
jgi:Carboxypeptidase regulatory-like domain